MRKLELLREYFSNLKNNGAATPPEGFYQMIDDVLSLAETAATRLGGEENGDCIAVLKPDFFAVYQKVTKLTEGKEHALSGLH